MEVLELGKKKRIADGMDANSYCTTRYLQTEEGKQSPHLILCVKMLYYSSIVFHTLDSMYTWKQFRQVGLLHQHTRESQ